MKFEIVSKTRSRERQSPGGQHPPGVVTQYGLSLLLENGQSSDRPLNARLTLLSGDLGKDVGDQIEVG